MGHETTAQSYAEVVLGRFNALADDSRFDDSPRLANPSPSPSPSPNPNPDPDINPIPTPDPDPDPNPNPNSCLILS